MPNTYPPGIGQYVRNSEGCTGVVEYVDPDQSAFSIRRDDGTPGIGPNNLWLCVVHQGWELVADTRQNAEEAREGVPNVGDYIRTDIGVVGRVTHVDPDGSGVTISRDDGITGGGEIITTPPYNGAHGWGVAAPCRYTLLTPGNANVTREKPTREHKIPLKAVKISFGVRVHYRGGAFPDVRRWAALRRGDVRKTLGKAFREVLSSAREVLKHASERTITIQMGKHSKTAPFPEAPLGRRAMMLRRLINQLREEIRCKRADAVKIHERPVIERLRDHLISSRKNLLARTKIPRTDDRHVGVEIECVIPSKITDGDLCDRLCAARLHNHVGVKGDGSVSGPGGRGRELVVLGTEDTIHEYVERVCKVLHACGAVVNTTCGLHVHLDMRETSTEERRKVYDKLVGAHHILMRILPASRKKNQYCRPNRGNPATLNRYRRVNWQALDSHGTLEVRSHSGTIDSDKISNWIKILIAVRDAEYRLRAPSSFEAFFKWTKLDSSLREYMLARYAEVNPPPAAPSVSPPPPDVRPDVTNINSIPSRTDQTYDDSILTAGVITQAVNRLRDVSTTLTLADARLRVDGDGNPVVHYDNLEVDHV